MPFTNQELHCDKVISMTKHGDKVGVYYYDRNGKEVLIAEMHPKFARRLCEGWNRFATYNYSDKMNKSFVVSSVCRVDLKDQLPAKKIKKIDDATMENIASKMGDILQEGYWEALEAALERYVLAK